jgi:hypothetical protein
MDGKGKTLGLVCPFALGLKEKRAFAFIVVLWGNPSPSFNTSHLSSFVLA